MKLTNLIWQCENRSPHQVIRADFGVDDIAQALAVADGKLKYINAHSPGGIKRSPAVIRSRSIAGKLADYSVKQVLLNGPAGAFEQEVTVLARILIPQCFHLPQRQQLEKRPFSLCRAF